MNRPRYSRPRRPAYLAGLAPAPGIPAAPGIYAPMPAPMPAPNHCGMTEESARCVVEELRPLNFTRSENVLFALIAGGVVGYFIGKGK
jgi:hypothetical protein